MPTTKRTPSLLASAISRMRWCRAITMIRFRAASRRSCAKRWRASAAAVSMSPAAPAKDPTIVIDIRELRSDPQGVAGNLARRGYALDLEAFTALEAKRKAAQVAVDALR